MRWVEDVELSLLAVAPLWLSRRPHIDFRNLRNVKTPEAWPSVSTAILERSPQLAATCTQRASSGAQAVLDLVGGAVHRVGFEIPPFEPLAESGTGPPAELPGGRQCATHSDLKPRRVERRSEEEEWVGLAESRYARKQAAQTHPRFSEARKSYSPCRRGSGMEDEPDWECG